MTTDHVTLMQIECSVVNTTLVKLKSETLPENVRKKVNDPVKTSVNASLSENKRNGYLKKTTKDRVDPSLPNGLQNSSNISNYPDISKQDRVAHVDSRKDDLFAQYLFSKYEESKDTSTVKNVRSKTDSASENV